MKMTIDKTTNSNDKALLTIKFTGSNNAINEIYQYFAQLQKRLNTGLLPQWMKGTITMNGNTNSGKEISYKN